MSRRSRYVFVCTKRRPDDHKKGSCAVHGSEELVSSLKLATNKAKLDVRVTSSGCFDLCWVGAAVSIMPDNVFLKEITSADIPTLVDALAAPSTVELEQRLAAHLTAPIDFVDPTKAAKEGPAQEGSAKDATSKDASAKEGSASDGAANDGSPSAANQS